MADIKELIDEELEKVSGGETASQKNPKYKVKDNVRFLYDGDYELQGTIEKCEWDSKQNQHLYDISHGEYNILYGFSISKHIPKGTKLGVPESYIMYSY